MFRSILVFALFFLAVAALPDAQKRDIIGDITGGAGSIVSDATSFVGSVATEGASGAVSLFSTVTSVGGSAVTVISSAGGQALTLVTSGAGQVTSIAGSVYTVATQSIAAGSHLQPWSMSVPLFASLTTVFAGVLVGAWATV